MTNLKEPPLLDESRGEFPLQIGDVHLGIAVTFTGLIKISKAIDAPSMPVLQQRLIGGEPWAQAVGIRVLSVDPDGDEAAAVRAEAALGVLTIADTDSWVRAVSLALAHHLQIGRRKRKPSDDEDLVSLVLADLEKRGDISDGGADAAGKPVAAPPQ